VPGESIFYSSGADTGVPAGSDLNAYVRNKVSDVGLVVALITPTFLGRPYCLAELGAAWSRVDNLFPLTVPGMTPKDMEGVLAGMIVRSVDNESTLDELHDRVCEVAGSTTNAATWSSYKSKWLQSATGLLSAPEIQAKPLAPVAAPMNGTKRWGQLFDSFVDAALYTDDDSVGREEILKAADHYTLVPNRYLYSSDSGADNWIRLCGDPTYRHHRESVDFWASAAGRAMAGLIHQELGTSDFDYVSLGAGDGQKDASLVNYWLGSGSDIFYYPYDISLPLVSRAIRTVRKKAGRKAKKHLHIKAVLADFNHLATISEVFKHRDTPNAVALLGNSLGNLEHDLQFLGDLLQEMSRKDLLILEVRLQSEDGKLPELETNQTLRFDFGPLEHYLGLTFDVDRMTFRHEKHVSSIPNTNTTIVGCADTVEVNGTKVDEVKLIYIHEYTRKDFLRTVEEIGFEIVNTRPEEEGERFLVCVVRKAS
jgi:hypothetical protein